MVHDMTSTVHLADMGWFDESCRFSLHDAILPLLLASLHRFTGIDNVVEWPSTLDVSLLALDSTPMPRSRSRFLNSGSKI